MDSMIETLHEWSASCRGTFIPKGQIIGLRCTQSREGRQNAKLVQMNNFAIGQKVHVVGEAAEHFYITQFDTTTATSPEGTA